MARGRQAPAALAGAALAMFLLFGGFATASRSVFAEGQHVVLQLPAAPAAARVNPQLEGAVLAWLNSKRAGGHLPPLRMDALIQGVARAYGREMFVHGYLSHVSRDGHTVLDRLGDTGLHFQIIGENLAYAADVQEANHALWESEPHRRNILYAAFRLVGIGVLDGGADGVVVVQDFSDGPASGLVGNPPAGDLSDLVAGTPASALLSRP